MIPAVVVELIGKILGSRTFAIGAAFAVTALVLFTWHKLDKSSAVRRAVAEYVADAELQQARAEADYERRQRRAAERAGNEARKRAVLSNRIAADRAAEIERLSAEAKGVDGLSYPTKEDLQWSAAHR